jgi:hypothetical protein
MLQSFYAKKLAPQVTTLKKQALKFTKWHIVLFLLICKIFKINKFKLSNYQTILQVPLLDFQQTALASYT